MPTTVRDDVEKKDVAQSQNNVEPYEGHPRSFWVRECKVNYPNYFIVGNSYRLIDDNYQEGRSMKLLSKPGAGMMSAIFQLN